MFHPSMSPLYGNPYGGMPPSMMGYPGPASPGAYPGGMEYDMMARYAQIYRAHQASQAHMGHSSSPGARSPSSSGRSSFESQGAQRGGAAGGGGVPPPAPPPLPPGAAPPGQHVNSHAHVPQYHPLTAEALARYQATYAGGEEYWEDGDEDHDGGSNADSSKQSVARRRHARRRRQLARLAAERMEWEVRSRQMEKALMQKSSASGDDAALPENLFADFRKALARALLLVDEVVERDDAAADDDPTEESTSVTSRTLSETDSEELANQLVSELRGASLEDGVESEVKNGDGANADGSNANDDGTEAGKAKRGDGANGAPGTEREPHVHPARVHSHGASKNYRRASTGAIGASLSKYLNSFAPTARGDMFSPLSHACFDSSIAGIEGVIALEHGLIMAQESGLFSPGELLVTAVSTRDLLTCFSGGGCGDVIGAPAERMVGTSLIAGLHAEDIRNLVFAFHLFPTILPEIECEKGKDGERESKDGGEGVGAGLMPAPNSVRLLPHGFLRRRHVSGAFVSMERLGGIIITNDAAAAARREFAEVAPAPEKGEIDDGGDEKTTPKTIVAAPKEERPFPTEEEIAKTIVEEPTAEKAPEPTTAVVSTPAGDIIVPINKYHPANKKDAKPAGATSAVRSALSAPSTVGAGRASSMTASASPFNPNLAREKSVTEGVPVTGAGKAVSAVPGGPVNNGRGDANGKTSEADLASLVTHCVRHAKKASTSPRSSLDGDELPEGIKDILLRLTRETFSENTILVTIERVRRVGGTVGSEVRHNSQMMVVSKLLNDLATRKHRALPERTPHTMTA